MTNAYRKIGEGVTDSNGRITVSYTGKGAGKIQLVAKQGSLLSETYDLYDCRFYQEGTSEPPSNTWILSNFTAAYGTSGTTLTSTSFATCFANLPGTGVNPLDFEPPFTVELDMVSVTSSDLDFQLYDGTTNATRSANILGITGNNHLRIVNDGSTIKYFVDGVEKTAQQYTYSMGTCRVGIRATGTVTFRNFMIY